MVDRIMSKSDKKGGSFNGVIKANKESEGKNLALGVQKKNYKSGGKIGRDRRQQEQ